MYRNGNGYWLILFSSLLDVLSARLSSVANKSHSTSNGMLRASAAALILV